MSENISEVFTSPIWWITVVFATLLLTVLGNVLTEAIKTILSKYSKSLRTKKSLRIMEQNKLVAELSTNHSRLSLYLTALILKFIRGMFLLACALFVGGISAYEYGAGSVSGSMSSAYLMIGSTLFIGITTVAILKNVFVMLWLLDDQLLQMAEETPPLKNQTPENE